MFMKEGKIEDYNLVCPKCGAIYYERPRRSEEIIKEELYIYGRVPKGHGPCFVPSCPGCGTNGYSHFISEDLKPRSKKEPGKVIKVKDGDIGPCWKGDFAYVKVDWDYPEENDTEKEKLIQGLKRFKNHAMGPWVYVRFPERNTTIHFMMCEEVLKTIEVFGRVSKEDAEIFVKDLLESINKEVK